MTLVYILVSYAVWVLLTYHITFRIAAELHCAGTLDEDDSKYSFGALLLRDREYYYSHYDVKEKGEKVILPNALFLWLIQVMILILLIRVYWKYGGNFLYTPQRKFVRAMLRRHDDSSFGRKAFRVGDKEGRNVLAVYLYRYHLADSGIVYKGLGIQIRRMSLNGSLYEQDELSPRYESYEDFIEGLQDIFPWRDYPALRPMYMKLSVEGKKLFFEESQWGKPAKELIKLERRIARQEWLHSLGLHWIPEVEY